MGRRESGFRQSGGVRTALVTRFRDDLGSLLNVALGISWRVHPGHHSLCKLAWPARRALSLFPTPLQPQALSWERSVSCARAWRDPEVGPPTGGLDRCPVCVSAPHVASFPCAFCFILLFALLIIEHACTSPSPFVRSVASGLRDELTGPPVLCPPPSSPNVAAVSPVSPFRYG